MENPVVFLLLLLLTVLVAALIYFLFQLLKRLNESDPPSEPLEPREPLTFVRGLNFNEATNRWQLTCRNVVGTPPEQLQRVKQDDEKDPRTPRPPVDTCNRNDGALALPLVVRPNDVVVFDFTNNSDFLWVDIQFPEPDLFVGLGGLANSVDDYIVRVPSGEILELTVKERNPCKDARIGNQSRFVYAVHVITNDSLDPNSPKTGYVQGGSPPEIRSEHA